MAKPHAVLITMLGTLLLAFLAGVPAHAVSIELKDGGSDRITRQWAAATGRLPLPGTPDTGRLDARLAAAGLQRGAPIFIRIFKDESLLELWMHKAGRFELFSTYPICNWDGVLGPKQFEGDRQGPEGFYTVGEQQLRWSGRYHRAFDLNFPNLLDRTMGRTGSAILIHGSCSSIGCFAMTDAVIDELFELATAAMASGQQRFSVHSFPFRMTPANMMRSATSPWADFWSNLKIAFDTFERTRQPPAIGVCNRKYWIEPGSSGSTGSMEIDLHCGMWMAGGGETEFERVRNTPLPKPTMVAQSRRIQKTAEGTWKPSKRLLAFVSRSMAKAQDTGGQVDAKAAGSGYPSLTQSTLRTMPRKAVAGVACNPKLASCRKHQALHGGKKSAAFAAASGKGKASVAKRKAQNRIGRSKARLRKTKKPAG